MKIKLDRDFREEFRKKLGYGSDVVINFTLDHTRKTTFISEYRIYIKSFWSNKYFKSVKTSTKEITDIMKLKDYILSDNTEDIFDTCLIHKNDAMD